MTQSPPSIVCRLHPHPIGTRTHRCLRFQAGSTSLRRAFELLLTTLLVTLMGCQSYEAPPSFQIQGLSGSSFAEANAPLVLAFSQPIDASTLAVRIYPDTRANPLLKLAFEDDDPDNDNDPASQPVYRYDFGDESSRSGQARGSVADDGTTFTVQKLALPASHPYVAVVLRGLQNQDGSGNATHITLYSTTFAWPAPPCLPGQPVVDAPKSVRGRRDVGFSAQLQRPSFYSFGMVVDMFVDDSAETYPNMVVRIMGSKINPDEDRGAHCAAGPCGEAKACLRGECVEATRQLTNADDFDEFVWQEDLNAGGRVWNLGCARESDDGTQFTLFTFQYGTTTPFLDVQGIVMSGVLQDQGDKLQGEGAIDLEQVTLSSADSPPLNFQGQKKGGGKLLFRGLSGDTIADRGSSAAGRYPAVSDADKAVMKRCRGAHAVGAPECLPDP